MKKQRKTPSQSMYERLDMLSDLISKQLPQKAGKIINPAVLVPLLNKLQGLMMIDSGIFGVIDYSTFKYIFITDNISSLGINKQKAIQIGLPYIAESFHPDELETILDKILPKVISFISHNSHTSSPGLNARACFTTRVRLANGEYSWFMHHMSTILFDENNLPLLILKSIVEIGAIKQDQQLNLILSLQKSNGTYETVEELKFPVAASNSILSARELQIMRLISAGYTSKKIASMLNVSIHTIHNHRKNIMRKKNSANMPEAIFSMTKEQPSDSHK